MEKSWSDSIQYYQEQLALGHIRTAYQGLMKYLMHLRNHFNKEYPDDYFIGHVYPGYMDISYFAFTPKILKKYKLKIALVFNHEKIRFEIWLAGQNRQIQKQYWEVFQGSDWEKYRIPSSTKEGFSIVDSVLVENPDFEDPDALTKQIESGAIKFIQEMLDLLN